MTADPLTEAVQDRHALAEALAWARGVLSALVRTSPNFDERDRSALKAITLDPRAPGSGDPWPGPLLLPKSTHVPSPRRSGRVPPSALTRSTAAGAGLILPGAAPEVLGLTFGRGGPRTAPERLNRFPVGTGREEGPWLPPGSARAGGPDLQDPRFQAPTVKALPKVNRS